MISQISVTCNNIRGSKPNISNMIMRLLSQDVFWLAKDSAILLKYSSKKESQCQNKYVTSAKHFEINTTFDSWKILSS
jgi:hypothetical protein